MKITQRNATLGDADVLLSWRNHPSVRRFSMQSELIPVKEHLKWLEGRLQRARNEPFYLFEFKYNLIGMCRFDLSLNAADEFEVSILIDPDQRSIGLGTKVLEMSCESFFTLYPGRSIVARVKKDNLASKKLFENSGFTLQHTLEEFLYLKNT